MASIRRLKKDIDCLTFAVVDDCLNCLCYGKSVDDLGVIVQGAVDCRNALRQRVNAGRGMSDSEKKAHYQSVRKEMINSADESFKKLSELVKA